LDFKVEGKVGCHYCHTLGLAMQKKIFGHYSLTIISKWFRDALRPNVKASSLSELGNLVVILE
jgi:hypothetical protein